MNKNYENAQKETFEKVTIHELINFEKAPEKPVKVSIVIPVCNVEKYLRECLDSAVNQTLQDIEIICVNDGSTDGSLAILKEYAQKDKRVKIIDKDNAGYGHTMNIGMDMASGKYIGIIESDDYVKTEMYETLYNIAVLNDVDMIKADYYRFTVQNDSLRLFYHALTEKAELYNKIIYGADNVDMFKFTNTWCGIYKKSFIDKFEIRHQETPGASYQDNGFWFQTTVSADTIYYLDKPFYMNRRDNPNSSVYQKNKILMANNEYAYIYSFLEKNLNIKEKYQKYYYVKKFDNYYYCYRQIAPEYRKEYIMTFAKEFANDFSKNEIDRSVFNESRYRMLCDIVDDPLKFYEETKEIADVSFDAKANEEDIIPIVFICDKGYVIPTATAISSLLKFKNKDTKYDITIIAVSLPDADIRRLSLIKKTNVTINIIYIEHNIFRNLHSKEITNYGVSATALIKFLLPELMEHCDKILYLDGDIIVKRDLSKLYSEELGECYAGVVRDIPQVLYQRQIFGTKYGRDYFNSGVMLLNVKKMRENDITTLLIETKKNIDSRLMDQDVFNEVFAGNEKQISIEYNTLYVNLIRSKEKYSIQNINQYYNTKYKKVEDIRRNSSIIHYCSKDKPWKYYDVPMADAWLEHFLRSAYGDRKLIRESSTEIQETVRSNGELNFLQKVAEDIYPFVFHYNCQNTKEILENLSFLKSSLTENEIYELYLLYENKCTIPKDLFEEALCPAMHMHYIEISKMISRDTEYSADGKVHENYYRMLVPEILCQYEKVLIIDGAVLEKNIINYLVQYDTDKIVNYINTKDFSFWDSPAVLIDTKGFICNITKFKFFDSYNNIRCGNFSFSKSFFDAIPKLQTGYLDSVFFKMEEKNIMLALEEELCVKNKYIHNLSDECKKLRNDLEEQKKKVEQLNYELLSTRTSFSCRLGLVLTAIPRKIFRRK